MYRGRKKAEKKIYGGLGEQYGRLWDYCETLRRTNPGSCVMVKVERPNPNLPAKFQRLYLSLGLVPSFDVVMPMADHRICVRHLYANFRDKGFPGVALKELLWNAALSYTEVDFRFQMEEIKKVNPDAFDYLDKIDPSGWSRAWFSDHSKCDLLVNNTCECFNSYILKARDKPILTMLEMIRKQLMRRYQLKRDGIAKLKGKLCPRIVEKLEAIGESASDCLSRFAGDGIFEVEQGRRQYAVDLRRRTCGCRKWEVTGIPCAHAHSAITFHGHKPEDYVDPCYSIEMYKKAYAPIIYPMPSEE
ncbi:uncharacterized protein LOC133863331 [Alnus glutinosa]|uniref:uncharacterized protein LOC133863331 n=1 Tax=Alnus glutinosa TaxID=3517 RepID=UPI002D77AB36|nr:uncharacterized protein LOC133863331 [Alnus glutinosa]